MIVNLWKEAPVDARDLLALAREHGWSNLPYCERDVKVAWRRELSAAPGGALIQRHLPSRQYSATAVNFETLIDALAWEAGEWLAVEAWRANHKHPRRAHADGVSQTKI